MRTASPFPVNSLPGAPPANTLACRDATISRSSAFGVKWEPTALPLWRDRIEESCMDSAIPTTQPKTTDPSATRRDTLTIIDNRTGKTYEVPITNDTIRANDLRKVRVDEADFGMMSYDPAFNNTASCISRITYIDGDKGILRYRGYPIEELAEKSTYLETAYLLLHGELPTETQLKDWCHHVTHHTFIHESIKKFLDGFHYDAHPMGMLISTIAALSTFYPDAKHIFDAESRKKQTFRLLGKMPTIAAFSYRHTLGMPYVYPDNDLSYPGNFLNMLFRTSETRYRPNPTLEKALDVLFILHADHEQNCSANTIRCVGSSHVDPFCASAAAIAALYGPLHGGANEEALRMLMEIGSVQKVPDFIKRVKAGETRLMGFGHRIYKNYDPRARIIKRIAYEVFDLMGKNPLLEIALECERIALEDEYFVKRKLYPNVDFYTGLIYQSMGFPMTMFPVLFAIPRMSGWVAQWEEMLLDAEQKIARPRQIYLGHGTRPYVPIEQRS
jgi:citrate synthase